MTGQQFILLIVSYMLIGIYGFVEIHYDFKHQIRWILLSTWGFACICYLVYQLLN